MLRPWVLAHFTSSTTLMVSCLLVYKSRDIEGLGFQFCQIKGYLRGVFTSFSWSRRVANLFTLQTWRLCFDIAHIFMHLKQFIVFLNAVCTRISTSIRSLNSKVTDNGISGVR